MFAYLVLETEDAYSADGSSPAASLCLPSALTCLRVPFVFSATFEAEKVMKRLACWELACWEFVLILGFRCLQGRRQWQSQYSSMFIAALLFSLSLCVLFLSLDLCSVFPLFFSPVSGFSSGFSFSFFPSVFPSFFLPCRMAFSCPQCFFFFSCPLRSLIFSGFIARECQASLQLKRLQIHYCRNRSCGRRRRRRRLISRNGAVCVMGMAICNLVTEVLKSCNQAPG